jgi:hypothetical protein
MAERSTRIDLGGTFFVLYLALKLVGFFGTWSWWWVLLPVVPFVGELMLAIAK